jgi:hypothetical protein
MIQLSSFYEIKFIALFIVLPHKHESLDIIVITVSIPTIYWTLEQEVENDAE